MFLYQLRLEAEVEVVEMVSIFLNLPEPADRPILSYSGLH